MVSKTNLNDTIVCVVGLGYVGMPLAEAFSKHCKVIGFDIQEKKVGRLRQQYPKMELTSDSSQIRKADFVIIAVPTPVTSHKEPDLSPVVSAAELVGRNLKQGAIVVLESTVYPGVTEEIVGPLLEKNSGLQLGRDFKIGYSPERVNPGDTNHTIDKITKVVSGMDEDSTNLLCELYGKITTVYKVHEIKVAEAAKVIENVQRDLNIALMNELSLIFDKMGLDTKTVLDAAATKWNFHRYRPGLVGGHCIPVDPYYLVYKAKELGHHPQVILAGRSVNDNMAKHVALMVIKGLNDLGHVIKGSKVLIMGLTYKENVPDTRETPVRGLINELKAFGVDVYGDDPLLGKEEIEGFGVKVFDGSDGKMSCVVITTMHNEFKKMTLDDIKKRMGEKSLLIDVPYMFDRKDVEGKGLSYKRL